MIDLEKVLGPLGLLDIECGNVLKITNPLCMMPDQEVQPVEKVEHLRLIQDLLVVVKLDGIQHCQQAKGQ
jgi:hypothetical protein